MNNCNNIKLLKISEIETLSYSYFSQVQFNSVEAISTQFNASLMKQKC